MPTFKFCSVFSANNPTVNDASSITMLSLRSCSGDDFVCRQNANNNALHVSLTLTFSKLTEIRRSDGKLKSLCLVAIKLMRQKHNAHIYTNLVIFAVHFILLDHLSTGQTAVVNNSIHICPGGKLSLPVCDSGQRGNDKDRPMDPCSKHL